MVDANNAFHSGDAVRLANEIREYDKMCIRDSVRGVQARRSDSLCAEQVSFFYHHGCAGSRLPCIL